MNSPVEKIKERLSIIDVVSSYMQVTKSGKNYKARCPFHNEKTPSFYISPERESFYCFGCGAKGDIFTFVEKFEGLDFMGALKVLADRAGIVLTFEKFDKSLNNKEKYYQILEEATKYFESNLKKNSQAQEYLRNRAISIEMIKKFRVGCAKDEWRSLLEYLIRKNFKKEDIEKVGLIKKSNSNLYDRFRRRIIFPICDSSGRVIAFTGRIFPEQIDIKKEYLAKYLNSPETPLFNKSNVLFAIDKAKNSIRSRDYAILVEGQFDLILSHQAGFTNTIAVSGTALASRAENNERINTEEENTNEQKVNNLGLIRRLSSNLILAFDGDQAGIRAAGRSAMIALSLDMQVKIAVLPPGKDPADIIKDNKEEWTRIIKNSVNIISFYLYKICEETNDIRVRGRKIREIIFPFLKVIGSSIERSAYINEISQKTMISVEAINEDFQKYFEESNLHANEEINRNNTEINDNRKSRKIDLEKKFWGIIFWNEKTNNNPEIIKICQNFNAQIGDNIYNETRNNNQKDFEDLAFKSEMWYGGEIENSVKDLKEIALNLEEEIHLESLNLFKKLISEIKRSNDKNELKQILMDYQKIIGRIEEIKHLRE